MVMPFIIAYVVIPWRFKDLFEIAVSQYEGVIPDKNKRSNPPKNGPPSVKAML